MDAQKKDIKKAFYKLAKLFHPDLSDNHETFIDILNAYETLIDDTRRSEYDNLLNNTYSQSERLLPKNRVSFALSLQDIAIIRYFNPGKTRRHSGYINPKGYDVSVSLSHEELQKGSFVHIDVPAHVVCPLCRGDRTPCNLCSDKGFILRAVPVPVPIPKFMDNGEIFSVPLRNIKKKHYVFFMIRNLHVKVEIIN